MSSTNLKRKSFAVSTHEGAPAKHISDIEMLKRSLMSCLLWEKEFYEDGMLISDRLKQLVASIEDKDAVATLAAEARTKGKLRHTPLFIARELVRNKYNIRSLLGKIIQRPDEISEFIAMYWADGKIPLANSVKKGLSDVFNAFTPYQLSKWDKNGKAVSLRDAMFLTHPKPETTTKNKVVPALSKTGYKRGPVVRGSDGMSEVWARLAAKDMDSADTWEVALSSGANKKEVFLRLMAEKGLGAMACLKNLRGMTEAGVPKEIISDYIKNMNITKVLPFRFIAAARYAPQLESALEVAMFKSIADYSKIKGKVAVLVDISGSMNISLSAKSDLLRLDAAYGLAMLVRELADDVDIFTFSDNLVLVADRRGFALRDTMDASQSHNGTYLGRALTEAYRKRAYDVTIVITDEQSHDCVPNPMGAGYMINVASCANGIGYGAWMHIDGFSESVLDFIQEAQA